MHLTPPTLQVFKKSKNVFDIVERHNDVEVRSEKCGVVCLKSIKVRLRLLSRNCIQLYAQVEGAIS